MEITHAVVLALIQGITEFLPVSSTAHLVFVPRVTGWQDQGLSFDVALNTATWLAVVIYFRADMARLVKGLARVFRESSFRDNNDGRLALMALLGTVPVGVAGVLARDMVAGELRTLSVIGFSSIIWGVVLWIADRNPGKTELREMGWASAALVGLSQAISLIPGTSRSGITMTAGLFTGLTRTSSATFSFFLAIIVGALAGGKEGLEMVRHGWDTPWLAVAVGFAVAFVSAYLAIHYFLKWIMRSSMAPFVAYRILLGIILLKYAYL